MIYPETNSTLNLIPNYQVPETYISPILDRIKRLLAYALYKHSRVLLVRMDFRYPDGYTFPMNNKAFSDFLKAYIEYLRYNKLDPSYVWCTEVGNESGRLHHHLAFMLDGSKISRIYPAQAEYEWAKALQLSVETIKGCIHIANGGMIINRTSDYEFLSGINTMSYLAKTATKPKLKSIRRWGSSELPRIS